MIELGSRRECFFDDFLIDSSSAEFRLHAPAYRGTVMTHDAPWEGSGSDFHNFFFDPDWRGVDGSREPGMYRMYYLGWQMPNGAPDNAPQRGIVVCYAESADGLRWDKPLLGISEFDGSRENNVILGAEVKNNFDNFMVFPDGNPACPPEEKYKAVARWDYGDSSRHPELRGLVSPDGLHFSEKGTISTDCWYDTLNVCFYDRAAGKYRAYVRSFHNVPDGDLNRGIRDVRWLESADFIHWTEPLPLDFGELEDYPLYTNVIQPYPRAPHQLIGFPSRYNELPEWSPVFDELTGKEARQYRMRVAPRYGLALTDCVFMTSRDGHFFTRYDDAFLRPGPESGENWRYGDGYPARGLALTPSPVPGEPEELSLYLPAGHWNSGPSRLVRYALRQDGFVSLHAGYGGAVVRTKPFTYDGTGLFANLSTSARGTIRFTLEAEDGEVSSFALFGDSIDKRVPFADSGAVGRLSGRRVRLRIELRDCDLYSIRFA